MSGPITSWFSALSLRWKLQLGFILVTMITTIYSRSLASFELGKMVEIATMNKVDALVIQQLQANHDAYIFNSFWESGLEFIVQFVIIGIVAKIFVRPILVLCDSLKAVEQGDLTREVKRTSLDEIGVLEHHFNNMLGKLNGILANVDESGKKMGQSAYQIAAISHQISEIGKNEQKRSAAVSESTDELNSISANVLSSAQSALERSDITQEHAQQGIDRVQVNIQAMDQTMRQVELVSGQVEELNQFTMQIHSIIDSIKQIAEQTNLLALNAAIEAARAGEQGRGFAVVADEVRSLAARTSNSAAEVSGIIEGITGKIGTVHETMGEVVEQVKRSESIAGETSNTMRMMVEDITQNTDTNNQIVVHSEQQIETFGKLKVSLDSLFQTLGESAAKVENTAHIGDDLYEVAGKLNTMMSGFTFHRLQGEDSHDIDQECHVVTV